MSDVKTAATNAPRGKATASAPAKVPAVRRPDPQANVAGAATAPNPGPNPAGANAGAGAAASAKLMSELKVSGHLMALDQGLYCITHAPAPGGEGGNLPGVRISVPPQPPGALERIAIASFRPDGFLHSTGDAALVRVLAPTAQVLVTIYQSGAPDGVAPNIQVRRLIEPATPAQPGAPNAAPAAKAPAGPEAAARPAAELPAARPGSVMEMVAHIQERADVGGMLGEWLGERGSKRWIEGFGVMPHGLSPADVEYQAVLGRGWLSPWVEGGQFCGSRGMALPVLGFRIRLRNGLAETHEVTYSASFIDGSEIGPVADGEPCESEALAAMEAFKITVRPRGQAAVDAAEQDESGATAQGLGASAGDRAQAGRKRAAAVAVPAAPAGKDKKGRKG